MNIDLTLNEILIILDAIRFRLLKLNKDQKAKPLEQNAKRIKHLETLQAKLNVSKYNYSPDNDSTAKQN
jgi:hypothetical protein